MHAALPDADRVGALLDAGRVRVVPDDAVPDVPDDVMPYDVMPGCLPDGPGAPDWPPDFPPDAVPVVLWPQEVLRLALTRAPGPQLARVVAESIDLAGHLDPAHDRINDSGTSSDADAGAGSGVLAELSDDTLGDLVVACARLQSWAAGLQALVVAGRAGRESHPLAHNSLVAQVTAELVVTEPEATEVVVRAESGDQHPTVIAALTAGRIDTRKAHVLLRSASQLTVTERAEAIRKYLPQAPRRTWKWLQRKMLAFAKDLHGAADTAKAAAQRRCVQVDRAENDMGWLSAYLPATDAAAVWGVVDDMAHQLRHVSGETRTLGQLRADSLTGIITGRLLPADRFSTPDENDDSVEAEAPVCTCGGRAPVQEVRITPTRPVVRVTIPATALLGLDNAPGHLTGYGPIPAETARTLATDATWQRLLTDPATGILTDYSTTTYQPGKVLRSAVEARDGTCTFLWGCETPAAQCDLDHIAPYDHTTNGKETPGQTRAHNLHPLCRKHHLLKTHAGWDIIRDPDTGITTWITPAGRAYARPPTVLDTHIDLEQIDPDTSHDLSLRALTGQRLPRAYLTTEPGVVPTAPISPGDPGRPPF